MGAIILNILYIWLSKKLLSTCVSIAAESRFYTQPNYNLPNIHIGTVNPYTGFLSLAVLTPGVMYGIFILNIALPVAGLGGAIPLLWILEEERTWFDWVTQGFGAVTWACMGYLCGLSFRAMFRMGAIALAGGLLIAAVTFPFWGETDKLKALRQTASTGKPASSDAPFSTRSFVAVSNALYAAGEQLHLIRPRPLTPDFIDEHIAGVWSGKMQQREKPFFMRFSNDSYTYYSERYLSWAQRKIRFEGNQKQIGFREESGPLQSFKIVDHDTLDYTDASGRHTLLHRVSDTEAFMEKVAAAEKIREANLPPALRQSRGR